MLLDVTNVEIEQDNKLLLEFENGAKRRFDMTPYLEKKPFDRLKDNHLFQRVHISLGTLEWPGNIDIDPETLWEYSEPVTA
jgi:hypothetical protein